MLLSQDSVWPSALPPPDWRVSPGSPSPGFAGGCLLQRELRRVHHTMCATTVERMGMEMADTGNNDDEQQWIATMLERLSHSQSAAKFCFDRQRPSLCPHQRQGDHRSSCARNVARPHRRSRTEERRADRRHGAAIRYSPLSMLPPHAAADASKNGIICPKAVNSPKRR